MGNLPLQPGYTGANFTSHCGFGLLLQKTEFAYPNSSASLGYPTKVRMFQGNLGM